MNKRFIIILIFLLGYVLLYKLVFISYGEIMQYIINPLIWIGFGIVTYFFLSVKTTNYFKYGSIIFNIAVSSALLYTISFYIAGVFIGYTHNPYSVTLEGIIINLFSLLLVIVIREYIRSILVDYSIDSNNYKFSVSIISIIFLLADINLINFLNSFKSVIAFINVLGKDIIPFASLNLFMTYLCKEGGYKGPIFYRSIVLLPSIVINILPNYNWIIYALFGTIFPFMTYIIIKAIINKRESRLPKHLTTKFNQLFGFIIVTAVVILFVLGFFPIKPVAVISGSMSPSINEGDVVLVISCNINDIKVGDVIQYSMGDYSIIHRVVEINNVNNKEEIVTKGDNNRTNDIKPVYEEQIIGKYIYRIPFIGYPAYWLEKTIRNAK